MSTRELLEELSSMGVGSDEDDPIAEVALAQARAEDAAEEEESSEWSGEGLLRSSGGAQTPPTRRRASAESKQRPSSTDVREDHTIKMSDEGMVLVEIRDLLKQQLDVLKDMAARLGGASGNSTARKVASEAAPSSDPEPGVEASADSTETLSEKRAEERRQRQERRKVRAAELRQEQAALINQGLSPEDALAQMEAKKQAEAERLEAEAEDAVDAVLEDVPMASSGLEDEEVSSVKKKGGRRRLEMDLDFDVSTLKPKPTNAGS